MGRRGTCISGKIMNEEDKCCCIDVFGDVNEAVVPLPLSGGTQAEERNKLPPASAALPFWSLSRNACDVIKQAGVKTTPLVPLPLQATFPVQTQAHRCHVAESNKFCLLVTFEKIVMYIFYNVLL